MTFKDLKLQLSKLQSTSYNKRLDILKDKPFWIWDKTEHLKTAVETNSKCCFNHCIGLPINQKTGLPNPMFDYEKMVYDELQEHKHKHIWILKATGLGITEFFLRYIAWLCLKDDKLKNSQICIVTGPRIELAIVLIDRMKKLFHNLNIYPENKETVLELNGVRIEAFPSHHLDTMRGLPNISFILLDEADFFPPGQQQDARDVSERYIAKSNPYIVMVSTPNCPGGLFENIEKEPEESCIYKRLKLDYRYGINRIYTNEEIEEAKKSPSFEREYNLKYLGKIGNLLSQLKIDTAIQLGNKLEHIPMNPYCIHSLGLDPGFGSSATGLVLTEYLQEEEKIRVIYANQFDSHPNQEEIIDFVFQLNQQYNNLWIFVDAAARGFITSLKIAFNENPDYEKVEDVSPHSNKIIPVAFNQEHKSMISHLAMLFNQDYIGIPEKYDKLILSLRTAQVNEYSLDKESTSYDDLFDALRLSLRGFKVN